MLKRIKCLLLTILLIYTCVSPALAASNAISADADKHTLLERGDYILLGTYHDENIVWRYVDDDENGKLFLSDKILDFNAFNAYYSKYYPDELAWDNYWGKSNIRTWLNSSEDAENIAWLSGKEPTKELYNEDGFLSGKNFSKSQKNVIKTVVIGTEHISLPGDYVKYYDVAAHETVFLLSRRQCESILENADVLGDYLHSEVALTDYARTNTLNRECAYYSDKNFYWFTRTPYGAWRPRDGDCIPYVRTVHVEENLLDVNSVMYKNNSGVVISFPDRCCGIRPAFYLNEENAQILSGSGTKEDPYVIDGKPVPERFEENGLYGYKDKDGNVIVPAKYLKTWEFSEGAALVVLPEDPYRLRYIDTRGNYLFDKAFYASNNFNNGYALVLAKDDTKYSYIDKTGEFATEILFDDAEDFCGGYARVKINGKWGVIDTNFNFKVPCEYDTKDEVLGKLDLS